jgi:hypothetical protein
VRRKHNISRPISYSWGSQYIVHDRGVAACYTTADDIERVSAAFERLLQEPGIEPAVHRRTADASASGGLAAGTAGLCEQMSE